MSRRRRPFALPLALLLAVACGSPEVASPLRPGDPAPDFSLPTLSGETLTRRSLAGQPLVVSFWATWCRPCWKEIPALSQIEASGAARVVAIALDESGPEVVERFVTEHDLSYPVLLGDEKTFRSFDGFSIPHSVVLDAEHRVVAVHRGAVEPGTLQADLDRAKGAA